MPKQRTITLTLEGKTDSDLDLAFDEAVSKIKEGYFRGGESNGSGGYSFDVANQVVFMEPDDISDVAIAIASQLRSPDGKEATEKEIREFAILSDGLGIEDFDGYIEGDLPSMVQCMLDNLNDDHDEVVKKLNEFFCFDPPVSYPPKSLAPRG